jgi:ornithine cyclodeaminase/alanine dehydrogenase-like protein (mu-crystallin family)
MFMAILLRETDVSRLATMEMALKTVEEAFRLQGERKVDNSPRRRCRLEHGLLHVMSASLPTRGFAGLKTYTSVEGRTRFHVLLYDAADGKLLAVVEADGLGRLRTGAASGVATRYMARADASRVGIIGTGSQARTQLEAVCAVRPVQAVTAYGRDMDRRAKFCREMSESLGIRVEAASEPEQAVRDVDIVITATTSKEPVVNGEWLAPGAHINAVGSNHLSRRELDDEAVRRSACVVVDSVEQSMLESGELASAVEAGAFFWEDARELGLVVVGEFPGREDDREITLFKSNGIALEDVALAGTIYQAAVKAGAGEPVSF